MFQECFLEQAGTTSQALKDACSAPQAVHKPQALREQRWQSTRLEEIRPFSLHLLPACSSSPGPLQMGSPSPGSPPAPRAAVFVAREECLSLSPGTPLPFDSPLCSVSADLCVLGIQLEKRTERVTAARNPASAPPSTPGGAAGGVGPACHAGPCAALCGD